MTQDQTAATESFPRQRARTQRFTLGEPRTFTVSADGSRVLFLRAAAGDDARTGLWLFDVASGTERVVVDPADDGELTAAERARRERFREGAVGVVAYAADEACQVAAFVHAGRLFVVTVDSGEGAHRGHHHYIPLSLVAEVDGKKVWLSANSDVAVTFVEEKSDPV